MIQVSNEWRFLRTFLAKPWRVASPVPSGRRLAESIAAQIEFNDSDPILELGPGTGSVTDAILARGIAASQLIAIESDRDFAEFLRLRFHQCRILEGDAFALDSVLRQAGCDQPFGAIICGVPVLNQPLHVRRRLLRTALRWLKNGSPFIQFSYGARPPIPPSDEECVHHAAIVRQNILPMHIWVYRAKLVAQ